MDPAQKMEDGKMRPCLLEDFVSDNRVKRGEEETWIVVIPVLYENPTCLKMVLKNDRGNNDKQRKIKKNSGCH